MKLIYIVFILLLLSISTNVYAAKIDKISCDDGSLYIEASDFRPDQSTVTVTSSFGGSDTENVVKKGK